MKTGLLPKVFAIVLNYNGEGCLIPCLDSLYASNYGNLEIIVIDNNSTDGSLESAKKKFSKFYFIKNSKNIGFAAGNNIAIRFALEKMADYVFLLNNDALVEENSIARMVEEGDKYEKNGIISPLIMDSSGEKAWFSGGKILWGKMKAVHTYQVCSELPYETEYASGCAMLIKKDVFRKIGLFDEKFFLYYEDADFSWRAAQSGFKILVVPQVRAYHAEKSQFNNDQKLYWLVLSGLIFFQKNSPWKMRPWISMYILARKVKLWLRKFFRKNDSRVFQIERAFREYKKY